MNLKNGVYTFECFLMTWTANELGTDVNEPIEVIVELSTTEIEAIIKMLHNAWDEFLFEYSLDVQMCTNLLKEHIPHLHDKVLSLANKQFINLYPNSEHVNGFGDYEIISPDNIIDEAWRIYKDMHPETNF